LVEQTVLKLLGARTMSLTLGCGATATLSKKEEEKRPEGDDGIASRC
jgi:hypothetical protein